MLFKKKKKKPSLPELYEEAEIDALDAHIQRYFGDYDSVLHEIVSPDIHVDIAVITPTKERDYYTLITMGMGAHRMNVPPELSGYMLERAELVICLPSDWKINDSDEKWYWPLRWLKVMARLPGEHNTWLGFGHTVPNGEPFADNTKLCCMLLSSLVQFAEDAGTCAMPDGSQVIFYQMIPIYQEEVDFKLIHDTDALLERMTKEMLTVIDINRQNVCL